MKKLNTKLLLSIIFGLFTSVAVLSLIWFNYYWFYEYNLENPTDNYVLSFALPTLINIVVLIFAKSITRKDVKSLIDNDIDLKKYRLFYEIFNPLINIILIICYYSYALPTLVLILTGVEHANSIDLSYLIFALLTVISQVPGIFIVKSIFKYKEKSTKVPFKFFRIIKYAAITCCLILFACICIFKYLPINEFKFIYDKDMNLIESEVYMDIRDLFFAKDIELPDKMWGKEVDDFNSIQAFSNLQSITIPNTYKLTELYNNGVFVRDSMTDFVNKTKSIEIKMKGEPIEWFVKDSIIYSLDEQQMFILTIPHNNELYISEKVRLISPSVFPAYLNDCKVTVSDDNPFFYIYDNVIWNKNSNSNVKSLISNMNSGRGNAKFGTITKWRNEESIDIRLNGSIDASIHLWWTLVNIENIIIEKDFSYQDFDFIMPFTYCKNAYQVDKENPYYTTFEGNLYSKDLTKLYEIKEYGYNSLLPNELQEISEDAIYNLRNSDYLRLPVSGDLIFENGCLYTKEYEKLIYCKNDIYLNKNTKEISKELLSFRIKNDFNDLNKGYTTGTGNNTSGDFDFLEVIDGIIYSKDKTRLIGFDNSVHKFVNFPKELKEIESGDLEWLSELYIEVDENNDYFEALDGNLYSKGKEEMLTFYRDSKSALIPKETDVISDYAIKGLTNCSISVDEDNTSFETYKGMLYSKGKNKLIVFGKTDDGIYTIAKETNEIGHHALLSFSSLNYYYYPYSSNAYFSFAVEEGNRKYGVYEDDLYQNDFSELLLFAIELSSDNENHKLLLHPECKYISDYIVTNGDTEASLMFDPKLNKYIQYIAPGFSIIYYPEYKDLYFYQGDR